MSKSNQILTYLLTYLLGLMKRSFVHEDSDAVKRLYTVLVRLHLKYSNTEWHGGTVAPTIPERHRSN